MKIFNYEPYITQEDKDTINNCIEIGIANNHYLNVFENSLKSFFNSEVVCCSSGTSALHLALLAFGIGPGDDVICPVISFAATWNTIRYVNANPVFVDIDENTWCIDTDLIESRITEKTKAIICVDLYGNPCNYDKLIKICENNSLILICDSAQAFGSKYKNKLVGTFGDVSCFSFNLNKILTTMGGGAVVLHKNFDKKYFIRSLLNQNKKGSEYDYAGVGYNYRLNSINASVGVSQLSRFKNILQKKQNIFSWYVNELQNYVSFQKINETCVSNNWFVIVKFKSISEKNNVKKTLISNAIEAKNVYIPATELNWIKNTNFYSYCPNAINFYETSLSLPAGIKLTYDDIKKVCDLIKQTIV